uniref:Cyclin N-terminal domain-containing protein n=1 Tax=Chromera velia CCMP2878 TaxID=1169474 RepID=A0A0G4GAJ6_9ALVE|mmetsp:Transcript_13211/g.26041  ORF Transcript_13211/g.26041 Transcript_13211/m.26041 type:complete len:262 (-) Transcript_13211:1584-2369(-)|eukprot:Cvel_4402.t1-p1 / transcript=Cvel_4402.t1 / gene=Cvel_4402 / organism=Chromera_velia_CCMP2878 / gene_product=Cyclin-Y-like protein 1, putative / transcript_product=Cyclin-Y-like protein 1, putative / location=Cvel_scaffold191:78545-82029(-) / protein_length=261 / sequence_SO=supercontig / SO=protein_coding / is_pseudo=false
MATAGKPSAAAAGARQAGQDDRLAATENKDLMLTSTISKPNMTKLIKAISLILLDQIEEDESLAQKLKADEDWTLFDEDRYLSGKPRQLSGTLLEKFRRKPTTEDIQKFITALYDCAEYSAECNVLSLLYINRLIAFTGMPLHHGNWRPLLFISLIVAQKVWDDKYLGNCDFAYIYPFFSLEEINAMEIKFIKLLQYHVNVKPSTYAKYYFELRSFFANSSEDSEMPLQPLNNTTAERLEKRSKEYEGTASKLSDKSMTVC